MSSMSRRGSSRWTTKAGWVCGKWVISLSLNSKSEVMTSEAITPHPHLIVCIPAGHVAHVTIAWWTGPPQKRCHWHSHGFTIRWLQNTEHLYSSSDVQQLSFYFKVILLLSVQIQKISLWLDFLPICTPQTILCNNYISSSSASLNFYFGLLHVRVKQ